MIEVNKIMLQFHLQQSIERLRQFQMNGGPPQQSFEETIHRVSCCALSTSLTLKSQPQRLITSARSFQLKVQEALRKKEKFQREHEEVKFDYGIQQQHSNL